ncbi:MULTISPECIES: galactose-1-phosphate uridylyltransferase [Thermotoga]|jgi:UDPglucose--hexose-1-phosphate uridylyltransferase|uniref:Galactose-1-phosphate uridylyltransferase n=2 Tax=Thermotoga petrophila TaxID=93929 RepID=A5IIN7_THEP1|nr:MULTISPECIES: galactose-1-phosphate uridylyltransferase [Thermotoga]MBZ4661575.1 galactose-phosphate uridylyltransferase [Thermotoga sp.]HBU00083.1 galactose-1-phosphate uridylyltransferase [Thermotoga petrophila]ABQ46060.1 galactose-1-phosphate uridylyltransferase [Thermotoga petrophila RKU-1]ACB08393.1 galactose-1-phosphate uridylyltransferase [Thermotoga sp. RQ2]ADA66139.1 galactose-1-phosphate uridylyltransferase [Thermotoga petrophila RKU-10]
MPEFRKDPIIKRWVIIATERAKRPHDFARTKVEEVREGFCPFDYGNEHTTPPEIFAFRPADTEPNTPGWWVRVVPNKFPAVDPDVPLRKYGRGMYDAAMGFGYHDVVVETPDHNSHLAVMDYKNVEEVIWAYKIRYEQLMKDERIKYILIFKNHGKDAGASLSHPHSQIIALPIMPKRVQEELDGSKEYYEYKERCPFCDIIDEEKKERERIVEENDHFIALEPFAARFPFETWILPKRHMNSFHLISEDEVGSLAKILKNVLYRIYAALDNPPYNLLIHTAPTSLEGKDYYHWHIEIFPRLTKVAGFEWGTGFYINIVPPEDAARYLREVSLEQV